MSMNTRDTDDPYWFHRHLEPRPEPSNSDVIAAVNRLDAKVDALRDDLLPPPSPIITGRAAVAEFNRLTRLAGGAR